MSVTTVQAGDPNNPQSPTTPVISLPKGGGAIQPVDEKFSVNAANGTASCSIPFPFSPSRDGFLPPMTLSYNSGGGNGVFGVGWEAQLPAITRKTEKQLPTYRDVDDVFLIAGVEDLVPVYREAGGSWVPVVDNRDGVSVARYRPRIEGGYDRIERITEAGGNSYWKVTTPGNGVSIFGKSAAARIADPMDPSKVFSWLLEFSYDDRGHCWQLEYKAEDNRGIAQELYEQNRVNGLSPCANVYVKRVRYGNKVHFDRASIRPDDWEAFLDSIDYLLEAVFDYGEHDAVNPQPDDAGHWVCRQDCFSSYRAGFEIRTRRLCRRVLMFHRFVELGEKPCLVASLELAYDEGPAFTFLRSATQRGFIRQADGSYTSKALPPVSFDYAPVTWNTEVRTLRPDSLANLPIGLDGLNYQWVDLYGEGLSGILTEQAGAWYYKRNAGRGQFESVALVSPKPSLQGLTTGDLLVQDLEARGQTMGVSRSARGFFGWDEEKSWQPFRTFETLPNTDWRDPNLKLLDLNGDGMADILITEDSVFTWYASLGMQGYGLHQTVRKALDEEKGPAIVFADVTSSLFLADMTGSGLTDIVRVRNGEICYWPNLGYGRFGAKVNMSNAPVLDVPERFDARYVRLADLDGSGTTDLVYLGQNMFRIYFNQAGNSWSMENLVKGVNPVPFPAIDDRSSVAVLDLLGTGTACIVWSSPLPNAEGSQIRYIDLMGSVKPHLLTGYVNGMGRETRWEYMPSSYYYLRDRCAGTPWVTRLPMVVQCVSQVIRLDLIRKTRFTNQYSYHHGYYDPSEREFRGFGRVEQTDTEDFETFRRLSAPEGVGQMAPSGSGQMAPGSGGQMVPGGGGQQIVEEEFHQPPVLTKTWFHTGAFLDKERVLHQFAHEYYRNETVPERDLPDPVLPESLTIDEWREALRACKGIPLRIEVFSPDGSELQDHPFSTTQQSCLVQLLQPRLGNRNAVFQVQVSESITYTYDRNPGDPRIGHQLTLSADGFGNVLESVAVSYGRQQPDPDLTEAEQAQQARLRIVATCTAFTGVIDTPDDYLLPMSYRSMTYEVTGMRPDAGGFFSLDLLRTGLAASAALSYESTPPEGAAKRLVEHKLTLYMKNDLSGPLGPGEIESLGLPYRSYQLALTAGLRDRVYGDKVTDELLLTEGGYVRLGDLAGEGIPGADANKDFWIPSGTKTYDAANFFEVTAFTDVLGVTSTAQYDPVYHWYLQQTRDALSNTFTVEQFNFRTLSPWLTRDINDNRNAVRMDELGRVISGFTMGKEGENAGDLLDTARGEASAGDEPSTKTEYHLDEYIQTGRPNFVVTMARETHYHDEGQKGSDAVWQTNYTYIDGAGSVVMKKMQAEPGPALQENADGTVTTVDTTPSIRWVGSGRTIVNNKGQAVMQYAPYFSIAPDYEDAAQLVARGVTSVTTYDAIGRTVRVDQPDGTFIRAVFSPWKQQSFDANDTVLESRWYRDRVTAPVEGVATPEEVAAAGKAAAHADTPAVGYFDSLGRNFLSVSDNGAEGKYKTAQTMDIEGNVLAVADALGRTAVEHRFDMLGTKLYRKSPDAGERWTLPDVLGRPLRGWDSRGHVFRYTYDVLRRPLHVFLQDGTAAEICTGKIVYGEGVADDKQSNLRGQTYRHYDGAGLVSQLRLDFKGNVLTGSRQFLKAYRTTADWSVLTDADLDGAVYNTSVSYDALNRPLQLQSPDGSTTRPVYNAAGTLDQLFIGVKGMAETPFIKNVDYDAKGQRQSIVYGNDTSTHYEYEPSTFRLSRLTTTTGNGNSLLQDLHYTYDPAANIMAVKDAAQQTLFFNNAVIDPSTDYTYDAIYQLKSATGREHIGQNRPASQLDEFRTRLPMPGDGAAMRNYKESYTYDAVGNILQVAHAAGDGSWTRTYAYGPEGNRLGSTTSGDQTETYQYDVHGNILGLSQTPTLDWDFKDALQSADLGGGGKAFYVYDGNGRRVRKVIERQDGSKEERLYMGGFEVYRKTASTGTVQEQTESVHVLDDSRRVALIETVSIRDGVAVADGAWQPLARYQYDNQLGSASLELDEQATLLSYEEYYPFGATSYQAMNAAIDAAVKRYRYTGMERDEESGLEYHNARYYLPWLGRWLSADPIGIGGGINLYAYAGNRPVNASDPSGNIIWFVVAAVAIILIADDAQPANAPGWQREPQPDVLQQNLAQIRELKARLDAQAAARQTAAVPTPAPAPAPAVPERRVAVRTQPRHSDWRMAGRGAVLVAAAATGGVAGAAVGGGELGAAVGYVTTGAATGVGNQTADDIENKQFSGVGAYAKAAGVGAAVGLGTGYAGRVLGLAKGPSRNQSVVEPDPEPPAGSGATTAPDTLPGSGAAPPPDPGPPTTPPELTLKTPVNSSPVTSDAVPQEADDIPTGKLTAGAVNATDGGTPGNFSEKDIAFGLTRPGGEAGALKKFAGKATVGSGVQISEEASTAHEGIRRQLIARDTVAHARGVINAGGRIRFSLKGFNADEAFQPGSRNFKSVTSFELRTIVNDPNLSANTSFYDAAGNDVTQAFLAHARNLLKNL